VALAVLLRGVNVGGHRTFRPTALAEQLKHLDYFLMATPYQDAWAAASSAGTATAYNGTGNT
jgi:hypothetical protein